MRAALEYEHDHGSAVPDFLEDAGDHQGAIAYGVGGDKDKGNLPR